MFSKAAKGGDKAQSKPEGQPASASDNARKAPKVASLIAEHMALEGAIAGDGELHLDGSVRGDVRVSKLTIGETGHVEGAIVADTVEIRGRVIGTLSAKQVRLYGTAYVDGDITHEQLSIEAGAFFQGRSLKFQRPAATPGPAAPAKGEILLADAEPARKATQPAG
ncbi:polymer-forming cytoskeletal protein [Phenylobacterium sp.]|uniref:bactofilin family protein n=1 Tax=Phenylobacterium sp. TaxID=1871053 RepID=UPI0035ADF149